VANVVGTRHGSIVALAVVLASCGACRHVVAPGVQGPEGRTSLRVLNRAEAGSGTPDPSEERITPAYPSSENKLPQYPAYALRAGCREGVVPVRVYVGTDGNVSDQRDIPDRPLPNDDCHMAFRAAVQSTVKDWKFAPAFRQKPLPGPDPRAPIVHWEQSPVAIYLDFEFSFEVVGGKGVVRAR
jgi:hypothetical protein